MKAKIWTATIALCAMATCCFAGLQDVEIKASRERLDQKKGRGDGPVTVTVDAIVYNVTVTNKTFKTIPEVAVKYMIFYEESRPGDPKPVEVSAKGSEPLTNLEGHRPVTFNTKPIELSTAQLDGNYYWTSGAKGKQKDRVTGVWIKAFAPDGKLLGEYANPTTVPKKNTWKD